MRRRTFSAFRHVLLPAVLVCILAPAGASAQAVPPPGTPPAQVQQQIDGLGVREQLLSRIQASGMTPEQVRRRLAAMGYDPRTLDPYLADDERTPPPPTQGALAALRALALADADSAALPDLRPTAPPPTAEEERLGVRVFGLEVFGRGSSEFEPLSAGAVPSSYVLGPGDELVLVLTGDVELVHQLAVTREGFVLVPQVGQVWVNGLTLEGLRDQLFTRLGRVYSGVRRGDGATTHFDISLARLRTNQVYISGEVVRPGAYMVAPLASVLNALYQAGGPTASGSFRDVHIVRSGRVAQRVDLYAFLLRGDNLDRFRLEPGDVIFVPIRGDHVSIRGEVTRPAIYELLPGEGIAELVRFAGGTSAPAHLQQARLTRVLPPGQRTMPGVDRTVMDIDLAEAVTNRGRAVDLQPGDEIQVLAVREEVRNMVTLNGSVWRPGSFEYRPGMRAWDLIGAGQGLSPEAFLDRAHITRMNPADSSLSVVSFSLARNGDGSPVANPVLEEFDVVTVHSRGRRVDDLPVTVAGAVREPGTERFQEGMTLRDAIIQAGGLRRTADPVVEVARLADPASRGAGQIAHVYRVTVDSTYIVSDEAARHYLGDRERIRPQHNGDPAAEFMLQPYDRIFVRSIADFELPRTVTVAGEVRYPGDYALTSKNERLRDVIERAGGLSSTAFAEGFRLVRDSQTVNIDLPAVLARPDHPNNIVLMPGDQMMVPEFNPVVIVRGAVNSPAAVLYRRGAGLDYYIKQAGGYARNADAGRTHVRFANGSGDAVSRSLVFFRSKPEPQAGSEVTVPFKLPEDRTDVRGIITDVVQIVGSIATVALVVSRLR
jgi:polysaccharide biosynthesis/export protein